jgi:hypothetical protein
MRTFTTSNSNIYITLTLPVNNCLKVLLDWSEQIFLHM